MKIAHVSVSILKDGNTLKKRSALTWLLLADGCWSSAGALEEVLLIEGV